MRDRCLLFTGSFICPGLPKIAEKQVLKDVANTYGLSVAFFPILRATLNYLRVTGKFWRTWNPKEALPTGEPTPMFVATEGKGPAWKDELSKERDAKGYDSAARRENVADLPYSQPSAEADEFK